MLRTCVLAILRRMWDRPLSKRQLGRLLVIGGSAGLVAVLAVDVLNAGREFILGPTQSLLLGVMLLILIAGLTLLPFGDRSA